MVPVLSFMSFHENTHHGACLVVAVTPNRLFIHHCFKTQEEHCIATRKLLV